MAKFVHGRAPWQRWTPCQPVSLRPQQQAREPFGSLEFDHSVCAVQVPRTLQPDAFFGDGMEEELHMVAALQRARPEEGDALILRPFRNRLERLGLLRFHQVFLGTHQYERTSVVVLLDFPHPPLRAVKAGQVGQVEAQEADFADPVVTRGHICETFLSSRVIQEEVNLKVVHKHALLQAVAANGRPVGRVIRGVAVVDEPLDEACLASIGRSSHYDLAIDTLRGCLPLRCGHPAAQSLCRLLVLYTVSS